LCPPKHTSAEERGTEDQCSQHSMTPALKPSVATSGRGQEVVASPLPGSTAAPCVTVISNRTVMCKDIRGKSVKERLEPGCLPAPAVGASRKLLVLDTVDPCAVLRHFPLM
jgi:hypothetical protein